MPSLSRRDFARFLAVSGSASLLPSRAFAQAGFSFEALGLTSEPLPRTPLGPGDGVIVVPDNQPSKRNAWRRKGTRFGFTVGTVNAPAAHPGAAGYVELLSKAITPRTKVLAIQVVSSNSGDLLPVADLCRLA